jgi:UDP-N-acetylmuramyl pentapeptide phosphotransferase/UDP-N-acetylglucosamine-1-phosphate transferase
LAYADLGSSRLAVVFGATLFISALGIADDLRPVAVFPRMIMQAVAVWLTLSVYPGDGPVFAGWPPVVERGLLLLAGLWFINLVNFMDGLDWITVAEMVPVTGAVVLLGAMGAAQPSTAIIAAALGGALLGFAPFNRPVAKIFLGDVGSLPIGLIVGWCLLDLVQRQHLTAALLLPLYYLADASTTLLRRLARFEPVWKAHRSHFYQRATDNGFTVRQIVGRVFLLNLGLAALAIASTVIHSTIVDVLLIAIGAGGVALTMVQFSQPRHTQH